MQIFSEKIDFIHRMPDWQAVINTGYFNSLNKKRGLFSEFSLKMKKYSLKCFDLKYFNYLCNM